MNGQVPAQGAFNFAQLGKISENALHEIQVDIDRIEAEIAGLRLQQAKRKAEADRLRKVIAYLQDPGVPTTKKAPGARQRDIAATRERMLAYLASRAQLGGTPAGAARAADITPAYASTLLKKLAVGGAIEKLGYGQYRVTAARPVEVAG